MNYCEHCGQMNLLTKKEITMCTNCGYVPSAPKVMDFLRSRLIVCALFLMVFVALVLATSVDAQDYQNGDDTEYIWMFGFKLTRAPLEPFDECPNLNIDGQDVTHEFETNRDRFANYDGFSWMVYIDGYPVLVVTSTKGDTLMYQSGWWWDEEKTAITQLQNFVTGHASCGVFIVQGEDHPHFP